MIRRRAEYAISGFVLAEALIGVVLISLMIALISAALTFGRRVADAGSGRERLAQMSIGVQALADWLSRAAPIQEIDSGGGRRVMFEGQAERLSFLTLSQGDAQPGGFLAVSVAFAGQPSGGPGALIFVTTPVPVGTLTASLAGAAQQELIGNLIAARFRYFGRPADGEVPQWLDHWTEETRLPELVALKATLTLGPRVETLDLTFRVFAR